MDNKIKLATYPEGWEEAKSRLTFLETDAEKEAFLWGIANYLYKM